MSVVRLTATGANRLESGALMVNDLLGTFAPCSTHDPSMLSVFLDYYTGEFLFTG